MAGRSILFSTLPADGPVPGPESWGTLADTDIGVVPAGTTGDTVPVRHADGSVEWLTPPSPPPPPPPTDLSGTNRSGGTIHAGAVVAVNSSPAGYTTATASGTPTRPAVGLATADAAALAAVTVRVNGPLTLADWTAATGSAALTPSAPYFLDPTAPGMLTATPPVGGPGIIQAVGTALTTDTMLIEFSAPIDL